MPKNKPREITMNKKNKNIETIISRGKSPSPLQYCKFCGCTDPLGPLPEHLTVAEMRIVIRRLGLITKIIADNISLPVTTIGCVITGRFASGNSYDKVEKYLLSIIKQNNNSTEPAQFQTANKVSAQK